MSKHIELLNKMSAKQKIALLTNIHNLADDEYVQLGIPRVKFTTLDELFAKDGDGLTPYTLARTWNPELISQVTMRIIQRNCGDANVIIVPSPKINLGGEMQLALSEDPLLSSKIALAFLSAVKQCNKIGALPDFCLHPKEVANLDIIPDQKALNDFIYQPFSSVVKQGDVKIVIGSISKNEGAYEAFNRDILRRKADYFSSETTMLCHCKTYDETLLALEEDCIILNGVESAIQNAYDQYLLILSAIKTGRASMLNLEEAIEHKTAISDQMLNAAIEKVIDFAFYIQQMGLEMNDSMLPAETPCVTSTDENPEITREQEEVTENDLNDSTSEVSDSIEKPVAAQATPIVSKSEEDEDFLIHAIEQSIVLLKNQNNTLPVKRKQTFAVIGDAALIESKNDEKSFADYLIENEIGSCVGVERGYQLFEERSDSLIPPAVALAKKASMVFVFLKARAVQNASYVCASLPANQMALIDALSRCKCNVIAVLDSDTNVDVSFAESVDGFMLAPIAGKLSAKALANVLFGRGSTGGKLTTSFHVSPHYFYKKQRFYKNNERNKVGSFFGYRRYDTEERSIQYPFGFGLKYSNIEISTEMWNSTGLSFSVCNKGKFDIDETIQVYVEKKDSKLLRPKKELKDFQTVHIKAYRSQRIFIKNINFEIYDEKSKTNVVEDGEYILSLGTSVDTIQKTMLVNVRGKTLSKTPYPISDYLQSKSNIISDNFILEAIHNRMANYKSLKYAGFVCLAIAVLIGLMSISAKSPLIPLLIAAVILLGSIAFFVISNNLKNRVISEEAALIEKNKQLFEHADTTEVKQLENLFLKEFKFEISESVSPIEDEIDEHVDSTTTMLNENMSFALAAADLKKFAGESGVSIDNHCAQNIIAAFASSRLIFAKTAEAETFDSFVGAVANYFGANLFTETITEAHNPNNRLLGVTTENGSLSSTAVLNAIISAEEHPQTIHIIQLKNLKTETLSDYLIPYIKYFSNAHSNAEISTKGSDKVYTIPNNVWFIVEVEKGTLVENIPAYLLECATLLPIKHALCEPTETKTEFIPITLTDFEFLSERCRSQFMLGEDVWKKIDAIEAFTYKYTSYKIGNKLWLKIETFLSTLLSMETEQLFAVDSTLACIILPTLAASLIGKLKDTDKTLIDEIERVFGEDNVQISHEMLVSKA